MGWKHKKLCPFLLSHLIIRDIHEKETKENPPYAPTLYSGSSLCYSIHWNIPPYLLDIYLKLLSQIVILYFISFNYPIGISFFRFFFYLFWILTYRPIGLYLCFFKIDFNERIKCLVVCPPFCFFISFPFVNSILTHR